MVKGYDPYKAERYFDNCGYEDIEKYEKEKEEKEEFLATYYFKEKE